MDPSYLMGSTNGSLIEFNYHHLYLVDVLSVLVEEKVSHKPSAREVHSLPELENFQSNNKSAKAPPLAHLSKSLPVLTTIKMSQNACEKGGLSLKKSAHYMEIASDENEDSTSPVYSDDFTDVISANEAEYKTENITDKTLNEMITEGISDVKRARQKLNQPQQNVLTTAINTLEELVKQLKVDIVDEKNTGETRGLPGREDDFQKESSPRKSSECSVAAHKDLSRNLEEKEQVIEDLYNKLKESAAIIEERSEIVEKLLNRLLIAEEALNEVKVEHTHVCDSVKDWYSDMDRTLHNKDSEILRLTEKIGALEERLKLAEDSATKWRVKYLNIEANHLNLKKNLATGRGAHVVTPVHDLIPPPPDVRDGCLSGADESMQAIAYVSRVNEREFKDSPYSQAFKPAFLTELSPRETSSHKDRKKRKSSRSSGSHVSSSARTHSRDPLPKLREKSRRQLRSSVRRAYGLTTAEETERSPRRVSGKVYPTLPSIATKRK